ncbi:S9 family peptidase [Shewanella sp. VB17]|uniref:S9 family peptidase n=1 Tax=Shewanella sp. VB17 TaxID=2739432 RepID=UPI0015648501|nr:S9 family peptidase [Shewanella sp. VB17]NRD75423.1 S9 family peptidase [Shewanella sp. VB17]
MTIKWITSALMAVPMLVSIPVSASQSVNTQLSQNQMNLGLMDSETQALLLTAGKTPLPIERMNASPALAGTSPTGLKLSPDGKRVTYLAGRKDKQHFYDLWQMDVASGKQSILLDADKLSIGELSDEEKARRERQRIYGQGIMEYFWSEDSKALLIPASGALYYYSLIDNKVTLLPTGEGFATDARLSPKGHFVSFVRDQNLFILNLSDMKLTAMTSDGGGVIKNAMAEFVAQEEMGRMTGYWWAPDETAIAYTRIDESDVELVTRNEIYADGIKLVEQRYPYAGKNNVKIALGVVKLSDNKVAWIDLGKEQDIYLPRVKWLPDSQRLSYQWQSRDQQQLDLRIVDIDNVSSSKNIVAERSQAWINLNDDLYFLKQQNSFIWGSERSGYKHLYLIGLNGKVITPLTSGQWVVDEVEFVDEKAGWIYFTGRKEMVVEKHLYRVSLAGGEIQDVSKRRGMHSIVFADNQAVYLDYFNNVLQPPQVSLHGDKGQHLAWVEQNKVDKSHPLYPYFGLWQVPEFGQVKADDGQALQYRLFKPTGFSEDKKYPVVVRVYGGPHAQTVVNSWSESDYFTQYLLQQGFIVFQLDNRGSANRGTKFEHVIYHHLGEAEVSDQKVGVDYLRSLPYVDADNIALYGHSYGGYMALMGIFKAPDYFKAAIAGSAVTDWSLYDTYYTERYLGHPDKNNKGYEASSVMPYAKHYQSGLLMYHGMADDNVLFENSTKMYKVLQDEGKLFQMIDYPGSKHSMRGEKIRTHLYRSLADFLERELK